VGGGVCVNAVSERDPKKQTNKKLLELRAWLDTLLTATNNPGQNRNCRSCRKQKSKY
jgi:hypothetical protein